MSNSFLHIVKLDGLGGAQDIAVADLPQQLPQQGGLWVHLDCNHETGREWLSSMEEIPMAVVDALYAEETRPRTTRIGDGLLLTLRGVNLNPDSDPSDMVSLRMWVTPHVMITSRRRRLLSVQDLLQQLREREGPTTVADMVVLLTKSLTSRMAGTIDALEETLSELEEAITQSIEADQRTRLVEKRLEIMRLKRFLTPQKEAIARLCIEGANWLDSEQKVQIKEAANDLTRFLEALESLRERSVLMQEEFVNLHSEKMNARMYVLSILSGIFLPLGFLTGLFGINIGGMPGTENGNAFWYFCLSLLVLGSLQYALMRKSRWF